MVRYYISKFALLIGSSGQSTISREILFLDVLWCIYGIIKFKNITNNLISGGAVMIKHFFPLIVLILLLCLFLEVIHQDSTYRLLHYVSGSGGILHSESSLYNHIATAGEIILGNVQTENHYLLVFL